jgi:hypothetical protein
MSTVPTFPSNLPWNALASLLKDDVIDPLQNILWIDGADLWEIVTEPNSLRGNVPSMMA